MIREDDKRSLEEIKNRPVEPEFHNTYKIKGLCRLCRINSSTFFSQSQDNERKIMKIRFQPFLRFFKYSFEISFRTWFNYTQLTQFKCISKVVTG